MLFIQWPLNSNDSFGFILYICVSLLFCTKFPHFHVISLTFLLSISLSMSRPADAPLALEVPSFLKPKEPPGNGMTAGNHTRLSTTRKGKDTDLPCKRCATFTSLSQVETSRSIFSGVQFSGCLHVSLY